MPKSNPDSDVNSTISGSISEKITNKNRRNSLNLESLSKGNIFNPRRWTTVFDDKNEISAAKTPAKQRDDVAFGASEAKADVKRNKSLKSGCGAQMYGQLAKKVDRKGRPTRFIKRFFVLKESVLMYFPVNDQRPVVKKWQMILHPKGVLCLGGCTVTPYDGLANHKAAIMITSADFEHSITIVADTELSRQKWLAALREAAKLTQKNARMGEAMIRELEDQGLRLHREKQEYVDRLQTEARALRSEIDKCEELEKVKHELEGEREKLTQVIGDMQSDLQNVRRDLELTNESKKTLFEEKELLNSKTEHYINLLSGLELEKVQIEQELKGMEQERQLVKQENTSLNRIGEQLRRKLDEIEKQQKRVLTDKSSVECKLMENLERSRRLEEEKEYYSSQALELLNTMNDLNAQKERTAQELREEAHARMLAERQLCAAEKALEHMEVAMKLSGTQMDQFKEHILPDVCQLKEYFEELAFDSRLDADKTSIMQHAVTARKSLRRHRNKLRSSLRKTDTSKKRFSTIGAETECDGFTKTNNAHQANFLL